MGRDLSASQAHLSLTPPQAPGVCPPSSPTNPYDGNTGVNSIELSDDPVVIAAVPAPGQLGGTGTAPPLMGQHPGAVQAPSGHTPAPCMHPRPYPTNPHIGASQAPSGPTPAPCMYPRPYPTNPQTGASQAPSGPTPVPCMYPQPYLTNPYIG